MHSELLHELAKAGQEYRDARRAAFDLRAARNALIVTSYRAGIPAPDVARAVGIGAQTVHNVVGSAKRENARRDATKASRSAARARKAKQ